MRVYTVPPRWLLDLAHEHELSVLAGLPWEQHVAFLEERKRADDIERRVRQGMQSIAGHPALLGVTIGNEIPASIVRWHGRKRIEAFLHRLYEAAKSEDPGGAGHGYVNFPTTEYLQLEFLDFCCYNVYLETKDRLDAYLARLQNLAGDKPLVMAEIGLDSLRNGQTHQAATLEWQVRTAFARGTAGVFVFAWTDEWHRGGHDIEDWDFGLTTRSRSPKPALEAEGCIQRGYRFLWPAIAQEISVGSYNARGRRGYARPPRARSLSEFLDNRDKATRATDDTAAIARRYEGVRVIETANAGLSSARNTGMRGATGEIVAYIDDDAVLTCSGCTIWPTRS